MEQTVLQTDLTDHSANSSARECLVEHSFVAGVLRELWKRGIRTPEVLRSEVDNAGYDIVIGVGNIVRHIQLKSSSSSSSTASQKVHIRLAGKPSGCVIWVELNDATTEIGPFRWFGDGPGEPLPQLPDRVAKHTKGDKDGVKKLRPEIRVINKGEFLVIKTMPELVTKLFGEQRRCGFTFETQ